MLLKISGVATREHDICCREGSFSGIVEAPVWHGTPASQYRQLTDKSCGGGAEHRNLVRASVKPLIIIGLAVFTRLIAPRSCPL